MGGLCLKLKASSHEVSFKLTKYSFFWTNATAHQQMKILELKRGHWTSLDRRIQMHFFLEKWSRIKFENGLFSPLWILPLARLLQELAFC